MQINEVGAGTRGVCTRKNFIAVARKTKNKKKQMNQLGGGGTNWTNKD